MKMRSAAIWALGVLLLMTFAHVSGSIAGVNVEIGVVAPPPPPPPGPPLPPPPGFVIPAPPPVVVIPGHYVYMVPDIDVDILFYGGYWWRPFEGRWYRARHYNGPWGFIAIERVPRPLVRLPRDYRHIPPGARRIAPAELNQNWKRWQRERFWERDEAWRKGRRLRERP